MPPLQPQPPSERKRADVNAGRIAGVFGLAGELKFDASRIGDDAVRPGVRLQFTLADGTQRACTVAGVRRQKGRPLLRLEGVSDANAAQVFAGAQVAIARDDAALGEGEYFDDDLIGCRIVDAAGVERGAVVDVVHYPNADLLAVGPQRTLVPLVSAFIRRVDVANRVIDVDVPAGLLDPSGADEAR